MDEVASEIIDKERQLADFDHARDDFEQAFSKVPEAALDYKPEGDDYSLRDLVTHIANSMIMYDWLLDEIGRLEYQEVRLAATGEYDFAVQSQRIRDRATLPPRNSEETGSLDQMEQIHDKLAARLRDMENKEFLRQAGVYYPGSTEVYPTAASDILGWLTDHYREHVDQVNKMVGEYESKA